MNILFRVDASIQIGSGHLMRCLTLAEQLKEKGAEVSFISRNHEGNLFNLINEKGYKLYQLPRAKSNNIKLQTKHSQWLRVNWDFDANETIEILNNNRKTDWLIIDHYAIDEAWEKQIRPYVKNIMVIDDLADRKHDCDILLDQNLYENMDKRYNGLLPKKCIKFLGPKYILIRPEFKKIQSKRIQRDGEIRKILVFFGGSDPTKETLKTIQAINLLKIKDITIDIVVGQSNMSEKEVKKICLENSNFNYYCQIDNMAQLMASSDLAIGAGGTTMWERCYLGLPSIVMAIAENQIEVTTTVSKHNAIWYIGKSNNVSVESLAKKIEEALICREKMKLLSKNSLKLMHGESSVDESILTRTLLGENYV